MHKTVRNKDLLCSMENSILYSVMTCMGKKISFIKKSGYMYLYNWFTRLYKKNLHNLANQGYSNENLKINKFSHLVTFPEWTVRARHWVNRKMFWGLECKHSLVKKSWRDRCPNLTDDIIFLSQIIYYFLVNLVLHKTIT